MVTANSSDGALPAGMLRVLARASWSSWATLAIAPLAVLSVIVTGAIVIGVIPFRLTDKGIVALESLDLILGLSLAGLIAWRWLKLWTARRNGRPGARLHFRLVALFSAIAVVPAVFVAIYAALTLNLGIETWFSQPVKAALDDGVYFARHYVSEQGQGIIYDAGAIADGLQLDRSLRDKNGQMNQERMFEKLTTMTKDRGLPGSFVIDSRGALLGSAARLKFTPGIAPSSTDLAQAAQGQIVVDGNAETGVIRALIHLPVLNDAYLLVVRLVDPKVFAYYQRQKFTVGAYHRLEQARGRLELIFAALYLVVSFVLLLAAIWLGLWAANRVVDPVSRLIGAAERVSEGDLKAQVDVGPDKDEISTLSRAFNRMMTQLDMQRTALVDANRQIDERRRFTETVLAGVTAGVLGLDADGHITIVNRAAARLLDAAPEEIEGHHYAQTAPEFAALIRRAIAEPGGRASGDVAIKRAGSQRALSVQVASERGSEARGLVVTFDDITDLVSAQRTAAWADVARRIAHEIKNPLTPIQLSAERLKRKYASEVSSDREVFEQCTDTIIRQVSDIGRMVDEFSSFARMPAPVMRREIAQELVQQAAFLQRVAQPLIAFETNLPKEPVYFEGDGRLLAQALTNVLKNASESIASRHAKGDEAPGRISIAVEATNSSVVFRIADNGLGLPAELRHRLTEPYVTTRAKGTGLGLAIVRKILEDHMGELTLSDTEDGQEGAEVTLRVPRTQSAKKKGDMNEQERLAHSS
jgi:two-component system nitrogen regulation sensor histidine kinase NtrY